MLSLPILFASWLACTGSTETSEPEPTVVEGAEPSPPVEDAVPSGADAAADDAVYVLASSLNLRESPKKSGTKTGAITVNSPLEILEEQDDWARVRVRNGKEGWVVRSYLVDAPLTVARAREEAEKALQAGDLRESVSWWQRAAAIDDAPEILEGLAAVYDASGQTAAAARVRSQLQWPARMLFIRPGWGEDGQVVVYWRVAFDVGPEGDIPRSEWAAMGLDAEEPWWVLLPEGPAVSAQVVNATRALHNECAGDEWVYVTLQVPKEVLLGESHRGPVLAHRGEPPEVWMQPLPGTRPEHDRTVEMVLGDARSQLSANDDVHARLVPTAAGWKGSVWWPTGEFNELGFDVLRVASVEVGQDVVFGKVKKTADVPLLAAVRDVTGDGQVEEVFSGSCESYVVDADGQVRAQTPFGCCGC